MKGLRMADHAPPVARKESKTGLMRQHANEVPRCVLRLDVDVLVQHIDFCGEFKQ